MSVQPIPEGFRSVTPYLTVHDAGAAIDFYVKAFGAKEILRMPMPDGRIGHGEVRIGDSMVMLGQEAPEMGARGPKLLGGTPVGICVYIPDVDVAFARAVKAGASVVRPLQDQFYGDRSGTVVDPFGHQWTLATHIEDPSPEEIKARLEKMCGGDGHAPKTAKAAGKAKPASKPKSKSR
jgi:PhnB protein